MSATQQAQGCVGLWEQEVAWGPCIQGRVPGPATSPSWLLRRWVPGELRQAATSCQAPASALSPLIGHPERAKSQLGVSPAGDLSNESRKAGGGWGCWGCQGVQIAHYHHKKHLVV